MLCEWRCSATFLKSLFEPASRLRQVEQAGEDSQVSQASLEAPETSQSSRLHDLEKAGTSGTGARKVQLRFQPGATLKGRRRFLAWNGCGA